MITTGARQAPTAPTKKIGWWSPKSVSVATAIGSALPAIAKRSARLRCLPLNRIGAAITRPSATDPDSGESGPGQPKSWNRAKASAKTTYRRFLDERQGPGAHARALVATEARRGERPRVP